MLRDLVARAAQQELGEAALTSTADHDQVGVLSFRSVEQYRDGRAVQAELPVLNSAVDELSAPLGFEESAQLVQVGVARNRWLVTEAGEQSDRMDGHYFGIELRRKQRCPLHSPTCIL